MTTENEIILKTATELSKDLESGDLTSSDIVQALLTQAEKKKDLGIYLQLDRQSIEKQAKASDERRKKKKSRGPLDGIPVALKDNLCVLGEKTTCSSKMLENFVSPYDGTVIKKLKEAGAILYGHTNLDEFAMGSSTENSAFQVTKNPWDAGRVPGGSSGGSAAAVASLTAPLSLGSDTGGSIRQPASLCGVVGVKPTYGRVSRYGLVAFASSLDQIGPFARSVDDAALLLSTINGHDSFDSTSHKKADEIPVSSKVKRFTDGDWKGLRVGVFVPDDRDGVFEKGVTGAFERAVEFLKGKGAKIVELKSKYWEHVIPIYYILATAEASSNLSRYDGIRYGYRSEGSKNLMDLYVRSRTEGFGPEVKRRILLGTFVLSSGYYDAYYNSAMRARREIQHEYEEYFQSVDVILQPTSPTTAFEIGEKTRNPLAMYQSDLMTISVNLGGVPAMNIPAGMDEKGLPVGLQLTADYFKEDFLFSVGASMLDEADGFQMDYSQLLK